MTRLTDERAAFERWLNPGQHKGNVSEWVEPGRYEKEAHQLAWLAWRARGAIEAELSKQEPVACPICRGTGREGIPGAHCTLCDGTGKFLRGVAPPLPSAPDTVQVPPGYRLLKDSTQNERSWPEDAAHENGNYSCCCCECGRMFIGHKRRVICRVCAAAPKSTP